MAKCIICGKEIEVTEMMKMFFGDDVKPDICSDECGVELRKRNKKVVDIEEKIHPDWQGPAKGVWPQ